MADLKRGFRQANAAEEYGISVTIEKASVKKSVE